MSNIFIVILAFAFVCMAESVHAAKNSCVEDRFERTLSSLKVNKSAVELISSDGPCDAKYFCYYFKVAKDIMLSGYSIPNGSSVEYCDGAGLKKAEIESGKIVSGGAVSCSGNVYFTGSPVKLCSCNAGKVEQVSLDETRAGTVIGIPQDSKLFIKNDRIVAFTPSKQSNQMDRISFVSGYTYLISSGRLEKVSNDDSRIPNCESTKVPSANLVEKINRIYGLNKEDFSNISYVNTCESYLVDKEIEGVFGHFSKAVQTSLFSVPEGTSVEFCADQIGILNTQGKGNIKLLGRPCRGYVKSVWRKNIFSRENQAFSCTLAESISEQGLKVPASVDIVFNADKLLCIRRGESTEDVTIGGITIGAFDYKISNGQITKADSCW